MSISFSESLSHQSGEGQKGQMADSQIIISLSAYSYAALLGEFRSRTLIFNMQAQKLTPAPIKKKKKSTSTFGELRRPKVTNL